MHALQYRDLEDSGGWLLAQAGGLGSHRGLTGRVGGRRREAKEDGDGGGPADRKASGWPAVFVGGSGRGERSRRRLPPGSGRLQEGDPASTLMGKPASSPSPVR